MRFVIHIEYYTSLGLYFCICFFCVLRLQVTGNEFGLGLFEVFPLRGGFSIFILSVFYAGLSLLQIDVEGHPVLPGHYAE